jgi:hypothetical protein
MGKVEVLVDLWLGLYPYGLDLHSGFHLLVY